MKPMFGLTSPTRSSARKIALAATAVTALLLVALQLGGGGRKEPPRESPTTAPQAQVNPIPEPPKPVVVAAVGPGNEPAAAREETTSPADNVKPAKDSSADESAVRRWQLGTHWNKEPQPALKAFSSWAERYVAADPTQREVLAAEGVELAQRRRADYAKLLVTDPREALAAAVPYATREQLPAAIIAELERRVSGKGDFLVSATVPSEEVPGRAQIFRHAMIGGERYAAHVFGDRKDQRTTMNISLHGVAMDNHLAVSESPVRLLEPGEPLAAGNAKAEPVCSVSGAAVGVVSGTVVTEGVVAAAAGDQVHWLCRGGHLEALEYKVRAAEGGGATEGGMTAGYYGTTANRRILVIMVDFSDYPGGAVSQTTAQTSLDSVTAFVRANAYNAISFVQKDVTPVLRMPRTASWYVSNQDPYTLMTDARNAAATAGYSNGTYDFDVIAFTGIGFPWGGLGYVGGKGSWVQGSFGRGVAAHELGHNFGNWHANSWVSSTIIGTDGTHNEYGNPFDVLGNSGSFPQGHHSANFKYLNGWLPAGQIHTVTANGTYRIYGQDFGGSIDPQRKYGIRIPEGIAVGGETEDYWIDYRPNFGTAATANGAMLQWGNDSGTTYASRLLDTQPGTMGNMQDAPLLVGSTFTDSARTLAITPIAKGGTGADSYMDIQINFNATPPVPLAEAVELTTCITGGDLSWSGQRVQTHDGVDAGVSGNIANNQQSWMETTVTGPGNLSYWWKVSSESSYDFLSFLVDGLQNQSISGEVGWQQRLVSIPAGSHTLRWRYSKDGSVAAGSDRGWVDQIVYTRTAVNDMFANSSALVGGVVTATGVNLGATAETGEPLHAGITGGKSVWWRWTAPVTAQTTITTAGSSYDTLLAVYTGSAVGSLTAIAGNDDSGGLLTSTVTFPAVAGTTYQIAVDGYYGASGDVQLAVAVAPPANDQFANRIVIPATYASGYTFAATKETGEPAHGGNAGGKSAWWSWTSPASGTVTISTSGSSFDTLLGVYTGTAVGSLTLVAGNDDSGGLLTSAVSFTATAGTTYQIAVDGYAGDAGTVLMAITLPPPANDQFANRVNFNGMTGTAVGYSIGATKEPGEPAHGGDTGGRSVWWSWTAPISGPVTVTTAGSTFDTLLGIYTGSAVGSLTLVGGNDDSGGLLTSTVSFTATAGTVYQIAVDGYAGMAGIIRLSITIPPPLNDAFANRTVLTGTTATGYNVAATKEPGEPAHGGNAGGKSVWWTWTAAQDGIVAINTSGSSFDTLLGVYTGAAVNGLTLVAGNDDSGGTLASAVRFFARAGTSYQIAVDGYGAAAGAIRLNVIPLAPLQMGAPQRLPDGTFRIWIGSADGTTIDGARSGAISVYATSNPAEPLSNWTRLTGGLTVNNGRLWIDDPEARNLPMRFYTVREQP